MKKKKSKTKETHIAHIFYSFQLLFYLRVNWPMFSCFASVRPLQSFRCRPFVSFSETFRLDGMTETHWFVVFLFFSFLSIKFYRYNGSVRNTNARQKPLGVWLVRINSIFFSLSKFITFLIGQMAIFKWRIQSHTDYEWEKKIAQRQ